MGNPVDAEQVCDLWPIQRPGPSQSKACRQRHRGEQDGARAIAVWLTQHQDVIAIAAQDIRQARRLSRQRPNVIRDNRLAVLHGPPFVHSVFERSGYRFA